MINDDEVIQNDWQKYVKEKDFQEMITELEKMLNKKTIYQVTYNEKELVNNIVATASNVIRSLDQEVYEKSGILQGANRQKGIIVEEEEKEQRKHIIERKMPMTKSFVDIINYIVNKTNFTRQSIINIILHLQKPSLLQKQNNIDTLVRIIEEQKKRQCYKYRNDITYILNKEENRISVNNMFLVNEVLETSIGHKVFETNESNRKALCKYFPVDSIGEYKFAEKLDNSDKVLMYAKIKKGSFIIENPIENYSPDWVIAYKEDNSEKVMYAIIETKWQKEWEDLSEKEQTKIICAKKHFEAVNDNIKYEWVNGKEI